MRSSRRITRTSRRVRRTDANVFRCGHGFDAHRLETGRPFVLGGVTIPFERGPLGHSDGDALAHAVADALLGACALGDVGQHFPAGDPRWAGAESLQFVATAATMVRAAGYEPVNVDATIVVDAPRLGAHLAAMRARLAAAIDVDATAVSVKAKSSEGMGYTGDGTGIAVYAVASVMRR
jgi:2-C-methyl-D-erythritol 2,4-cyclodiphosphate synthase